MLSEPRSGMPNDGCEYGCAALTTLKQSTAEGTEPAEVKIDMGVIGEVTEVADEGEKQSDIWVYFAIFGASVVLGIFLGCGAGARYMSIPPQAVVAQSFPAFEWPGGAASWTAEHSAGASLMPSSLPSSMPSLMPSSSPSSVPSRMPSSTLSSMPSSVSAAQRASHRAPATERRHKHKYKHRSM